MPPRLLIITSKLPNDSCDVIAASGGMMPALEGIVEQERGVGRAVVWVGSNGSAESTNTKHTCPVTIPAEVEERGLCFAQEVLCGVFHHKELDEFPIDGYEAYAQITEIFAKTIKSIHRPGDLIWIHDYHHLLLPKMLRTIGIDSPVGVFLHIPFPSSEIFRKIPWRRQILEGMLGSDFIGFQTEEYLSHFTRSVAGTLRATTKRNLIVYETRVTRQAASPIGLNIDRITKALQDPEVLSKIADLRARFDGKKIIIGVDRMDTIKGLPQKLQAFEKLLADEPSLIGEVLLVQTAVPARKTEQCHQLRREVEELVGRINARYSTFGHASVYYKYDFIDFKDLVALYSIADVCLVTSLREGMNLVSQEFIACQQTNRGLLILSEFAGAARNLAKAFRINPWNTSELAGSMKEALTTSQAEREARHASLYKYVTTHTAVWWGSFLIKQLEDALEKKKLDLHTHTPPDVIVVNASMYDSLQDVLGKMPKTTEVVFFGHGLVSELEPVCSNDTRFHWIGECGCTWRQKHSKKWDVLPAMGSCLDWTGTVLKVLNNYERMIPGSRLSMNSGKTVFRWSWADAVSGFLNHKESLLHSHECYLHLSSMAEACGGRFAVHYHPGHHTMTICPAYLSLDALTHVISLVCGKQPVVLHISVPVPCSTHSVSLCTDPEIAQSSVVFNTVEELKKVVEKFV